MARRSLAVWVSVVIGLASGCDKKKVGIATLASANGPVEREHEGAWRGAQVGTQFFLGDAVRTGDGSAELVVAGTQVLEMAPNSVLRFAADTNDKAHVRVELGAYDVVNSSTVGMDIGSVRIAPGGRIHVTADQVELVIGAAQVKGVDGRMFDLVIGSPMSIDIGRPVIATFGPESASDAGVRDAGAVDAASDATPVEVVEVEISGPGAELSVDGERWKPLAPGKGTVAVGTRLRLKKSGTTAKLVSGGISLELSGAASQVTVWENLLLGLERGAAKATVPAATKGAVGVPGGQVEVTAPAKRVGEVNIDVNAKGEAKVAIRHGAAKLVTGSTSFDMAAGETASIAREGAIHPGIVVPKYFDFQIDVGDTPRTLWIHDGRGETAVQFAFAGKCPDGGTLEADRNSRFRTPRISEGEDAANMLLAAGAWSWRLRCGEQRASGRAFIIRDNGRRPLPPRPSMNTIDADGRNYTIAYQSLIPIVAVRFKGTGSKFKLHITTGGVEQVFESTKPTLEIPDGKLREGNYALWFERDGVKQEKITTLKIAFDQTAAQVYIESPIDGRPFGDEVNLSGAALPGWTAKVDGIEIPVIETATRRFRAKVPRPRGGAKALAIQLSHPQRGTHYYLRRETR